MAIRTKSIEQGLCLVEVSGPLNARQFDSVTETFTALARQGVGQVIVSLKQVDFIDSRGLAALVTGYRIFGRQPQNFRLAELSSQPRLLFDVTGFDQIFEIYNTVIDARQGDTVSLWDVPQPVMM